MTLWLFFIPSCRDHLTEDVCTVGLGPFKQRIVGTRVHTLPGLDQENDIGMADGVQPMCYDQDGDALRRDPQVILQDPLGLGVQRAGRFVED